MQFFPFLREEHTLFACKIQIESQIECWNVMQTHLILYTQYTLHLTYVTRIRQMFSLSESVCQCCRHEDGAGTLWLSHKVSFTQLLWRALVQCLCHRADSVFCVWWVRHVCWPRLLLTHVPVQTLRQAFKPVVHQVMAADGGHWITRRSDLDAVTKKSREQMNPKPREKNETAADDSL